MPNAHNRCKIHSGVIEQEDDSRIVYSRDCQNEGLNVVSKQNLLNKSNKYIFNNK